jgi:putative DNA primase/helicase
MGGEAVATTTEPTLLDWGVAYASMGFRVLPVHTIRKGSCSCGGMKGCKPGKHPIANLVRHGLKDATTDESTLRAWWSKFPDANVAIATGKESRLVVVDIDGPEGEAALAELEKLHGPIPRTVQVGTARGRHLHFSYPPGVERIKSSSRQDLKIDIRGDGGYVVAPPSVHHSGKSYEFFDHGAQLAVCPGWLVEFANGNSIGRNAPITGSHPAPERAARAGTFAADLTASYTPPRYSEAEADRIRSALAYIPAEERDMWFTVGAALHWLSWGEEGYGLWRNWSLSRPEKLNEADQEKNWKSFDRPYQGQPLTIATVYRLALDRGWKGSPVTPASVSAAAADHDPQEAFFRATDIGNARRLVERHGQDLRYVHAWKKWVIWRGDHWSVDECGTIDELAKETVESIHADAQQETDDARRTHLRKHALKSAAADRLQALVRVARTEGSVVALPKEFDADPWLLGVTNGVIELKTQSFREARREDFVTKRARVNFDRSAQCPRWIEFLNAIMGGDQELIGYLQRVVGYILTGSTREEVLWLLYGTGANGKSTFREVLHTLLGDYALASDASLLVSQDRAGTATPEVARLQGRRLIAINETAENAHLNEARVKFITSNDMISARYLHENPFDFIPTHKALLTTNHKPVVKGTDAAIWRRVHLLPFTKKIENPQKDFREKVLIPELSGILNWALEGLRDYLRQGLVPPKAVLAATEDYRQDMDVIGRWIEECCDLDPGAKVPTRTLHAAFTAWAEQELGWEFTAARFARELGDRGFGKEKGTSGIRCTIGLRLKPQAARPTLVPLGRSDGEWR